MNIRVHSQQKTPQSSTTAAPVTNPFQSRPFAVQAQPEQSSPQKQETLEGKEQQEKSKRVGYNLANISISERSTPAFEPPIQSILQRQFARNEQKIVDTRQYDNPLLQRQRALERGSYLRQNFNLQPKLAIGQPGDKYEQEADNVAEQVISMAEPAVQQMPIGRQGEEEESVQKQSLADSITPVVQRQEDEDVQRVAEAGAVQANQNLENRLASQKGGGSPLSKEVRSFMEPRFGADFSQVRVHTNSEAIQMNRELQAQAFTHGRDLYFGALKYNPSSSDGKRLLAHELTHVVQQTGRVQLQGEELVQRTGCGCPYCSSMSRNLQRQPALGQSGGTYNFVSDELTSVVQHPAAEQGFSKTPQLVWQAGSIQIQRSLWGSIKKGFQAVGSAIKNTAETAWSGIKKGAGAFWNGVQWVGAQLWSKVTGIFQRVIGWITKLPERIGRLLRGIWEGVKSLKPWSLKWWESLGDLSTWEDLLKWLGTRLIDLIEIAGVGEVYETIMDFIKFNTRSLTGSEIGKARSVFGSSINYSLVRVDEAAVLGPSWTDRPYTSFHTINSWGTMDDHTLIHELTHVWQYEKAGAIYMPQAIHAQNTKEGYDYGGVPELQKRQAAGQGFASFNREQQAQLVADYYAIKNGLPPSSEAHGAKATDIPLYEYFMADVRR